ncbi:MAG: flagellar biosynthetic protein FliR [Tabrizicola sp.]|nr:flagellar biosynthetic protein FliR [Tabrizicola sp.]
MNGESSFDGIVTLISDNGITTVYPILIMLVLRPFGMVFSFLAFTWALRSAVMVRVAVAIALALPTLAAHVGEYERLIEMTSVTQFLPVSLKEFGIGYALGFLASLPFFAMQYAGAITDVFRGENDPGYPDPTGGTLHTFSTAYLVIGFFAFFSLSGFEKLVQNLYESYGLWPVSYAFPSFSGAAVLQAADILTRTLWTAIRVALPLLAMLVVIEFSVAIAARLGRRFNFYDLAFPLKNFATAVTVPLMMWVIWQLSDDRVGETGEALFMLEALFQ